MLSRPTCAAWGPHIGELVSGNKPVTVPRIIGRRSPKPERSTRCTLRALPSVHVGREGSGSPTDAQFGRIPPPKASRCARPHEAKGRTEPRGLRRNRRRAIVGHISSCPYACDGHSIASPMWLVWPRDERAGRALDLFPTTAAASFFPPPSTPTGPRPALHRETKKPAPAAFHFVPALRVRVDRLRPGPRRRRYCRANPSDPAPASCSHVLSRVGRGACRCAGRHGGRDAGRVTRRRRRVCG